METVLQLKSTLDHLFLTMEEAGLVLPAKRYPPEAQDDLSLIFGDALLREIRQAGYPGGATIPWTTDEFILCNLNELREFQAGYRIDARSGVQSSNWPDQLHVIASVGADPFSINAANGQVFFSRHGMGSWQFERVADDLGMFIDLLARWIRFFVIENGQAIMNEDFEVETGKLAVIRTQVLHGLDGQGKNAFIRALGV